jgi:hypothetical protein
MRLRKYVVAMAALSIAFLLGVGFGLHLASVNESAIDPERFKQYALFTWNTQSDDLCFALMHESESTLFIRGWTSKWGAKCGITKLNEALGALPRGTYVSWYTWPPKDCDYPNKAVVTNILELASQKGVEVKLVSALE